MPRPYIAALLTAVSLAGAAHAQDQTFGDMTPPGTHWVTPKPYARRDQVDQGNPNDDAHRADRAYTADLNRYANARTRSHVANRTAYARGDAEYQAELREHDRAVQQYQAERAQYAEQLARWRARTNACESGYYGACGGQ